MRLTFNGVLCLYAEKFVWRQLGVAFFGATASAVALFNFRKEKEMEEKILIKGEVSKKTKTTFISIIIGSFALAVFLFLYLLIEQEIEYERYSYWSGYWNTYTYYKMGYLLAFDDADPTYLSIFCMACVSFIVGVVTSIIYLPYRKCEITVTEKNVRGKAIFGEEVVLPFYMVSACSTRKFLSKIAVATSSGLTNFSFIENYAEIGAVLAEKINERQENTVNARAEAAQAAQAPANNAMDDLVKLKGLLDSGIITEEEFEAKKKQLLGL